MKRRGLTASLLGLALGGCGGDTWLGSKDPPPLPGVRKPVMVGVSGPVADPRAASVAITLPPAQANADWPQYGMDAAHAPQNLTGSGRLATAWSDSIGRGARGSAKLLCRPIVAGGSLFAVDAAGVTTARDAASGREIWSHDPDSAEDYDRLGGGGVAFGDGMVFVTLAFGEVRAIDAATGQERWKRNLGAPLRAAPTVLAGGILTRTADNQLYALRSGDGEVAWRHAGFIEAAGVMGAAPPAAANGVAVVAYSSGEIQALQMQTGRPIWSETLLRPRRTLAVGAINDISGAPVILDGTVYCTGAAGEVAAINLERGGRLWETEVGARGTPWVSGDMIYVVTELGLIVALVRQSGGVHWVAALASEGTTGNGVTWSPPIMVDSQLVTASSAGEIAAVSPLTGEVSARLDVGGRFTASPIAAGGTIYALSDQADLTALR